MTLSGGGNPTALPRGSGVNAEQLRQKQNSFWYVPNVTWKVLLLGKSWFPGLPGRHVAPLCWERERMEALASSGEVKRPMRVSRALNITTLLQAERENHAFPMPSHRCIRKHQLVWESVHCICSSSCRASGVFAPQDVGQQHPALFVILL